MTPSRAPVRCRRLSLGIERLEDRRVPAITWSVSFDDPGKAHAAFYPQIRETLIAAGQDWGRYLSTSKASIQVAVKFADLEDNHLANASNESSAFWKMQGKIENWELSVPYEIRTGKDANGAKHDAVITFDSAKLSSDLWFDPTLGNRDDEEVPSNKEDAYSVLMHELGHCLGFGGWRDKTTGKLPSNYESRFDQFVSIAGDGTPYFNGPAAKAQNGNQPVPLTYSNLMHFGNDTFGSGNGSGHPGDDLRYDLMNGIYTEWGRRYRISPLDIAVLQDIGLPATQQPVNTPPLLADIGNQTVDEDNGWSVPLVVGDLNTPLDSLVVTTTSNNAALLPPASLVVSGTGAHRTLFINPATDGNGTATITVTVSDGSMSVSDTFSLAVTPVRDPPTVSGISDVVFEEDQARTVTFAVGGGDVPLAILTVAAASNNPTLFPPGSLVLGGANETRTLLLGPAPNASGSAVITVTVSDGELTVTKAFFVNVTPVNDSPTVSEIPDQFIATSDSRRLRFAVHDAETPANDMTYRAICSNEALILLDTLRIEYLGSELELVILPRPGQEGLAAITVFFGDGSTEVSRTFNVRVAANPYPWRNAAAPFDVDNDALVAPNDVLAIINYLNDRGAGPLPWREASAAAAPFFDVRADNVLAPNDALEVINYINDQIAQANSIIAAQADGEAASDGDFLLLMARVLGSRRRR